MDLLYYVDYFRNGQWIFSIYGRRIHVRRQSEVGEGKQIVCDCSRTESNFKEMHLIDMD